MKKYDIEELNPSPPPGRARDTKVVDVVDVDVVDDVVVVVAACCSLLVVCCLLFAACHACGRPQQMFMNRVMKGQSPSGIQMKSR